MKNSQVTIYSFIKNDYVSKSLLDFGECVNLISYSFYEKLGLWELKPTTTTLFLAYKVMKIPRGIVEDVLIHVDKFFYHGDFITLDLE